MKEIITKISTINCYSLPKTDNPKHSKHFIRFVHSQSFDILALQETHAACYINENK